MPINTLNAVPGLPRFGTPGGPANDADWQQLYRWLVQASQAILQSTLEGTSEEFAATPASSYLPGTPFFVTDRQLTYIQVGGQWVYQSGEMYGPQVQIGGLGLGLTDSGFRFNVTDYGHQLRWNGLGWEWGPSDPGSGWLQLFEVDPTGPGWQLYDGSDASYLKSDGTLGTIHLPNLVLDPSFLEAGSPNVGVTPAVDPAASGAGGTISTDMTGVTIPANTGNDSGSGTAVQSGAGTTVATHTHTHAEGPVEDPGHTHTFTAVQPTITGGKPQSLTRRPFFRQ